MHRSRVTTRRETTPIGDKTLSTPIRGRVWEKVEKKRRKISRNTNGILNVNKMRIKKKKKRIRVLYTRKSKFIRLFNYLLRARNMTYGVWYARG